MAVHHPFYHRRGSPVSHREMGKKGWSGGVTASLCVKHKSVWCQEQYWNISRQEDSLSDKERHSDSPWTEVAFAERREAEILQLCPEELQSQDREGKGRAGGQDFGSCEHTCSGTSVTWKNICLTLTVMFLQSCSFLFASNSVLG